MTPITNNTPYVIFNVSNAPDGYQVWNVNCSDDSGNWAYASSNNSLYVDTTAPAITAYELAVGGDVDVSTVYAQNFTFNGTITETNVQSITYSIYNFTSEGEWINGTIANSTVNYSQSYDGIYLPVGLWIINVSVTDRAGNNNWTNLSVTSNAAIQPTLTGTSTLSGTIGSSAVTTTYDLLAKGYPYVKAYLNLTTDANCGNLATCSFDSVGYANIINESSSVSKNVAEASDYTDAETLIMNSLVTMPYTNLNSSTMSWTYNSTVTLSITPYSGLTAGTYTGTYGFGIFDSV